ncbi:UNKNOWN [Stylonychia lemnae]|uniref:Uncharacterized protein n=1 Tax=Stylonychia lemnae TaxID=5949 RepID=A0A077ZRX6_STYLE|nr:UNKNOWN [Stylonychia lemnae]|eukprot:CDW71236.1 UNKNOWN [Stylonychia lemnae]
MRGSQSVKNLHASQSPMSRTASQPYFMYSSLKKDTPSFLVKAQEIPPVQRTIDFDRLLMRPSHKPNRLKFDKTKSDCLLEEDHFKLFDMPWIQKLRFVDPQEQLQLTQNKKAPETTIPDRAPHFFDQDMQKWHQKFEKAINERTQRKKLMQTTHEFNMTTKNSNFQKSAYSLPKRRMSRQSNEAFLNVDFECLGNTNDYNHLIQKRVGGVHPNPVQLDFEMNLRNYKSQSQFKGNEPWIYPKTKKMKAVVTDKSIFPQIPRLFKKKTDLKGEGEENGALSSGDQRDTLEILDQKKAKIQPYNDVFRESNMGKIRHLFQKSNIIQSMQWQANLRHWHPDRLDPKKDEANTNQLLSPKKK